MGLAASLQVVLEVCKVTRSQAHFLVLQHGMHCKDHSQYHLHGLEDYVTGDVGAGGEGSLGESGFLYLMIPPSNLDPI